MRTLETKPAIHVLALSSSLLVACNGAGSNDIASRSMATVEVPSSAAAAEGATPGDAMAPNEPIPSDWEPWVAAESERIRKTDSELYNAVRSLQPRATRSGQLRFSAPDLLTRADAAPLLLDRFVNGNEPEAVRAALAEAMAGTEASVGPAIVDLLERERSAYVRQVMVSTLRQADADSAQRGITLGLADADPSVRTSAIYTLGRRSDGAAHSDAVIAAASDREPSVQQAAVQVLGALRVDEAKETIVGLLSDDSPELRYLALRALERIDAAYAAALPQARTMRDDPDPRVAKLAARLTDS